LKQFKILVALVLAVMMMASVMNVVLAADDGSIKVTNATKGQAYEAFLVFPASVTNPDDLTAGVTYTATAAQVGISGFDTYFDKIVNNVGTYTISKKNGANDNDVITWIKTNIDSLKQGSAITGSWTDNDTYTFSNLAYGYYYITSSLGTLVTIDTAGKDVSVYDKNESTPTGPDKKITAEDNAIDTSLDQNDVSLTQNDTSVGSVETFTVTFSATNWVKIDDSQTAGSGTEGTKVTEWNFVDTPTGLDIDKSTVAITVNGTDITSTVTNIAVDSSTGVLSFTIPWVDGNGKHLYATQTSGSELIPVVVTYDATITAEAATAPAPNEVEVKYNNTTTVGNKVTTTTYTYKFLLKKTDENDKALEGAEFQLFFGSQTDPLTFTMNDGKYQYDPDGTVTNIAPTGNPATAEIIGLDNTSYTLKEVVVPTGYNKAADTPVTGLVKEDGTAEASATTITVKNEKGTELPSTGGIGTTIFYIAGAVLVLGAAAIVIARRKAEQD